MSIGNALSIKETVSVFDFLDAATVDYIKVRDTSSQSATAVTAAFRKAAAHLWTSFHGGVIRAPAGKYLIRELELGLTENNITIVGEAPVFYDASEGGTEFYCPDTLLPTPPRWAVWVHRRTDPTKGGSQCAIENVFLTSNGTGGRAGVEYGLIISTNLASLEGVSVTNFQHGLVGWGWNSNRFSRCSFSYNTRIGVALLDQAALGYQAPRLAVDREEFHPNSIFTFDGCNIRRNQIGVVLRAAARGSFVGDCVLESNYRHALVAWDSNDILFASLYLEGNNDEPSSAADLAGYTALRTGANEILKGSINGVYGSADIGHDILIGESREGTSRRPDDHQSRSLVFRDLSFAKGKHTARALRVRGGFGVVIERPLIKDISGALFFSATPSAIRTQIVAPVYRENGGGSQHNFIDGMLGTETIVQEPDTIPVWHGRTNDRSTAELPPNNLSLAVGKGALAAATTGGQNTAIGPEALENLTTGSRNTAVGQNTGGGIQTGSNNTILGANVTALATALANNIILALGDGTIEARFDGANWTFEGHLKLKATKALFVGSNQVVSARAAPVADASGGATVDAEARRAINTLLARLRTHGLIAP